MARVRGNSRSALNLRIKKKKEEKDAIKHGSEKVISTSRQGKKQYKYWDSNKKKYVSKENLTAKKVKPKVTTQSGLTKAELEKKQKDLNFRRRQGESSSRTDKGYQADPPPKKDTKKDTSNKSSTESSSNGSSSKTENKIDTKTAFSQDKTLVENKKTEKKTETKKYGRAPKGYIKTGGKFASLKSVKGKRAAMKADRLKILQDRIKKKKKEKK